MSPDRWLVLTARVPSAELSSELAEGLVDLGGTAVVEDGDRLTTYRPAPGDLDRFLEEARLRLIRALGADPVLEWHWQDDEDWTERWRQGLEPRTVGRITVTQPWNPVPDTADRIVIVVDPSSAFGTGEHATTRSALRMLQAEVRNGYRVLDVGTGSGILAMAAVRLGAERVLAVESDPDAVGSARSNLERNGVAERIDLQCVVVDAAFLESRRPGEFDLVVANVLSGILVPLIPGFARNLGSGGLILGGILDTEAADVVEAAAAVGLGLVREAREEEWWTGLFRTIEAPAP